MMEGASKSAKKNAKRAAKKRATQSQTTALLSTSQNTPQHITMDRVQHVTSPSIWWVRADLRVSDNPALTNAKRRGGPVIPVFVACEDEHWPVQGAAGQWLHHALQSLDSNLTALGSPLVLRKGDAFEELLAVVLHTGATHIFMNNVYEPWLLDRDANLVEQFTANGVVVERSNGGILYEPWEACPDRTEESLLHGYGSVGFFQRACRDLPPPGEPLPAVQHLMRPPSPVPTVSLDQLGYGRLPRRRNGSVVDWAAGIRAFWNISEAGAWEQLRRFLQEGVYNFENHGEDKRRFRADESNTAVISPYVRFGQLSPRSVHWETLQYVRRTSCHTFLRRFAWRDLAYWSLWRFPHMADRSLRVQYDEQRWDWDDAKLKAWQRGRTGFPLVDAAMRQLWQIGWMPNYMRHITAGFLIEFMNMDWRLGLAWYHDTLVDSDIAINAYMWQNGGHSGLDQWNFVMHPVNAAKSCDPEGEYTRRWVPELKGLPVEYIHCPWEAPTTVLAGARVVLGRSYPRPIIADLEKARINSLDAVLEVRRRAGSDLVLPDGNELLELDDGRSARLITRVDYREMASKPITKQTSGDKWNKSKRDLPGPFQDVMRNAMQNYERMQSQRA